MMMCKDSTSILNIKTYSRILIRFKRDLLEDNKKTPIFRRAGNWLGVDYKVDSEKSRS